MPAFTHLHTHSEYSLLDGLGRVDALIRRAKELGMDSLALTDHGVMYAAIDFYLAAKEHEVKAIIGLETYVAPNSRFDRKGRSAEERPSHLTLLARDLTGYQNLIKLTTVGHLEGFYYKPRIDREVLAKHSEGLICLSGCASAEIPRHLFNGNVDKATKVAEEWRELYGRDSFYLELQRHDWPELDAVNKQIVEIARKLDIPLAATNDIHYVRKEDARLQDILLCVQTGTTIDDAKRMRMRGDTYYMRSPEEMEALFAELPESLANTARIAEECHVKFDFGRVQLPEFPIPDGFTPDSYLEKLCRDGLKRRYHPITPEVDERLRYELEVIRQTGFALYMLIVWDIVRFARERGIPFGPRGSAAGAVVCYTLGISDVDPIANRLVFERFLNIERREMPDIDMDFADDRREEMINYVTEKYGRDRVAQIITFGTLAAKAAIRDVGRAMGMSFGDVDRVSKLVPTLPLHITIEQAMEEQPALKEMYESDDAVKRLIDAARGVEGVVRHASTHAAGVVISRDPLSEVTPLQLIAKGEGVMTQYHAGALSKIGLLKMDFLGLANLAILRKALEMIRQTRGLQLDLLNLPPEDVKTFDSLARGETVGIFQLEGSGMTRYLMELKPTSIADLAAMVALYRPGPMANIPQYIARKHGDEPIEYPHPLLEETLRDTFGVLTYQDQVLHVLQRAAGYSLGQADIVRKAMGKKVRALMEKEQPRFVAGCLKNGLTAEEADRLWELLEPFAGYGFNRCLAGETLVTDVGTGRQVKLIDVVEGREPDVTVPSFDEATWQIVPRRVTAAFPSGRARVFRVRSECGREIVASWNHPFYTQRGWVQAEELRPTDYLAAPRQIDYAPSASLSDEELTVLAYALAEGNLCHTHGFYVYAKADDETADYVAALESLDNSSATVAMHRGSHSIYAARTRRREPSGAVEFLRGLGVLGHRAREKFVPSIVFRLPIEQIARFIGRLWVGDGCVSGTRPRARSVYYATSSQQLARDVQHLLLRLGFRTTLHTKDFRYLGRPTPGYTVTLSGGKDAVLRFNEIVGPHLVGKRKADLDRLVCGIDIETEDSRFTSDRVPLAFLPTIAAEVECYRTEHGESRAELFREIGLATGILRPNWTKRGIGVSSLQKIAAVVESSTLSRLANADVVWERVASLEDAGEQEVYDLTVEGTHTFVANDLVVHNSHAACYAQVAYQTAYLKSNYPAEYMTAVLSSAMGNTDKVTTAVAEARRLGVEVRGPDVNRSVVDFSIEADHNGQAIRFGLGAVKNVGENAVEPIISARQKEGEGPFKSLDDFVARVDAKSLNKRVLESLIKAGALDAFGQRSQLLNVLDRIIGVAQQTQRAQELGQGSLFDFLPTDVTTAAVFLPDVPEAPSKDRLAWEKEMLGIYVSEHPLHRVARDLEGTVSTTCGEVDQDLVGQKVTLAGMVRNLRQLMTKKREAMVAATLEDLHGTVDVVAFPRTYERTKELWQDDAILIVSGKVDSRDERLQLIVDSAELYHQATEDDEAETDGSPARPLATVRETGTGAPSRGNGSGVSNGSNSRAATANGNSNGHGTNGNGHAGNGNGHGNGSSNGGSSYANGKGTAKSGSSGAPRRVTVVFRRGPDEQADVARFQQLHDVLYGHAGGSDSLILRVLGGAGVAVQMEIAALNLKYDTQLGRQIAGLLGDDCVQLESR